MRKNNDICNNLTFDECELAILRLAVDTAEKKRGKKIVTSDEVVKIVEIVEDFIRNKKLICYGGTAINNILPIEDQFYDKNIEMPDYDFFTPNAMDDAKELANIYYKKGFEDVEAKSGQHHGTYKVFVNYIPVADLTYLDKSIYNALKMDSVQVDGMLYAPPNFLRMAMYLELSRPAGDTSRWEKVLKRISLLNKNYPITNVNCSEIDFQREMTDPENTSQKEKIYDTVRNSLVNQGVVFFGGYAITLYSHYMPKHLQTKLEHIADFDVLSNTPDKTANIVKERLKEIGVKHIKIIRRSQIGEIIPEHYEVRVGKDTVAFIYKPIACHSFNEINIEGKQVKVATIDTMLSFYLAFLYADRPYYNVFLDRILCMSKFLFDVQQKNRLEQKGLLKRFSISCYGHQETVEEMRAKKASKYKELREDKKSLEFQEWFLNYKPGDIFGSKKSSITTSSSSSSSSKKKVKKTTVKTKTAKTKKKTGTKTKKRRLLSTSLRKLLGLDKKKKKG